MRWRSFWTLGLVLLLATAASAGDVAGSADLPGIGRFEGSEITSYKVENYGETTFATGPIQQGADASATSQRVEGKITRIVYRVPPGSSGLEVFRNFEGRIAKAGFELRFSGGPDQIHAYTFTYKHPVEILNKISMSDEIWYAFGAKTEGAAERFIALLVSPHSGGDGMRVRLITAETKAMEDRMVDAEAMKQSIQETGRVALYGIYFDTDSDVVKPSSEPTLVEIGRYLKQNPGVQLIVVGHTDNQGSFDHNLELSRRRAASVTKALTAKHGAAAKRLRSAGVGFLAPAATNDSADGRALNRRVELVKER